MFGSQKYLTRRFTDTKSRYGTTAQPKTINTGRDASIPEPPNNIECASTNVMSAGGSVVQARARESENDSFIELVDGWAPTSDDCYTRS
jgi:hypothetical protein